MCLSEISFFSTLYQWAKMWGNKPLLTNKRLWWTQQELLNLIKASQLNLCRIECRKRTSVRKLNVNLTSSPIGTRSKIASCPLTVWLIKSMRWYLWSRRSLSRCPLSLDKRNTSRVLREVDSAKQDLWIYTRSKARRLWSTRTLSTSTGPSSGTSTSTPCRLIYLTS